MVLCCHAHVFWGERMGSAIFDRMMAAGWIGVDLFFVLSGFLITGILLATRQSKSYLRSFYVRRILRIFPLYYLFLSAMFLSAVLSKHSWYPTVGKISLLFFGYNLYAVSIGRHLPWVSSFWSLAVEEQFYLVWPFLVLFLSNGKLKAICVFGMGCALAFRIFVLLHSGGFQSAYYLTYCRMDELLAGSLLAILRTSPESWKRVKRWSTKAATAALLGILLIAVWSGHFADYRMVRDFGIRHSSFLQLAPGISLLGLLFSALVAKSAQEGAVYRSFLNRPMRMLGKYSYGMYVLHLPILDLVDRVRRYLSLGTGGWIQSGLYLVFFCLTLGVAVVAFHIIEKPILRLKRYFPAI